MQERLEKLNKSNSFFFGSTGTKVLITTGRPDSSATKTEVVDVVNGESCADLADFPLENCGAVGANLHGTPVVCGGYSSDHSPMKLLEMLHLQQQLTCTMQFTSINSTVSLLSGG